MLKATKYAIFIKVEIALHTSQRNKGVSLPGKLREKDQARGKNVVFLAVFPKMAL